MRTIVKSLIYDDSSNLLVLLRSGTHPHYPNEEDLPGGELEGTENPLESVVREIYEETSLTVAPSKGHEVLSTIVNPSTRHILFTFSVSGTKPLVRLSWEHHSYTWSKGAEKLDLKSKDDYISTVNKWLASNNHPT